MEDKTENNQKTDNNQENQNKHQNNQKNNQKNEKDNDGAVVIFSGGQDSTTCLFWAEKIYGKENVLPVSFDYGQKHKKELEAAENITKRYGFSQMILPLEFLKSIAVCALTEENIEVDKEIPKGEDYPNTFVPGRNLFFLSIAGVIARNNGRHNIITGVSESDFSGYPDCREEFIKSAEKTISLAMDYEIKIHTPLMHKTKAETWKMAEELGIIDLIAEETVTCYNGIAGSGCGECPACTLRQKGLEEYKNGKY
ncbi:7-cyano-7-deazaguanine synthase [Methanimicrococcus hongohii]|uniref:7-cyano-7-deazaguanine synthase n=1 Tax=Methanimicrococcus hongohii TaxID=3028295 RepID=A0AA96ZTN0_9EURY|nr:7-cyano-7-deazaguanine synthase QueC [Methanimicrococcus sp. Hf6]WNY22837.1 7-cyano-7-deazaguanine synthase [Methanimicrococcus sp. Hf6]